MKFNFKKKKILLLIFTIIFLLPNFFWLYLSYKNKTFPYYELGYLYRKIDREVNKLFSSEKDYALKIINKQYIDNSIFYEKDNKIDTIYLPLKVKTINLNQLVQIAQKGGSLTIVKNKILIVDRLGNFFIFDFNNVKKINTTIQNNLVNYLNNYSGKNIKFTSDTLRTYSIVFDEKEKNLYVSFTKFIDKNISRLVVSRIKFDLAAESFFGEWEDIFSSEDLFESAPSSQFGGGKMVIFKRDLYLTVGYAYEKFFNNQLYSSSDDINSATGKVIKINLDTKNTEVITRGHRNSQGLTVLTNGKIISTEHGDQGGDKINEIVKGSHYGYPHKSFGTSYGTYQLSGSDDQNSKYKDPIYYFSPSIGISSVIESTNFNPKWNNNWLIGSLKARTLYRAHVLDNRIISVEPIWIGDRIRDIVELNQKIIILTDQATIIILEVDNDQLKKNIRYNNLDAGGLYVSLNDKLNKCVQCHSFTETNPTSLAPSLYKIFNKKIASDNYQNYSDALKSKSDLIWNYNNLFSYIKDPQNFSPGTTMPQLELEKRDIDDIINLLKKQSLQ